MRISHLSDIHFRSMSRHDELKKIFEAFADDAKKNNIDHIFIGGDTWHTKLHGISPEFIDLFVWWIDLLSSIAPVHMILGNHDVALNNLSRQDAISPLIKAINNSRVFLYKTSGVYNFAPGFNWCVFSIIDQENWDDVKPVPGDVNIAVYHGSIQGASSDEYEVKEGLTVDFFKDRGFKFAMLGDIHAFQFLDYREIERDEE